MNIRNEELTVKIMKWIFTIITIGLMIYFVIAQMILPSESAFGNDVRTFTDEWYWVKEDGTREMVTFPGDYKTEKGEDFIMEAVIPEDATEKKWLCFRSSQQDMQIYIGDSLRQSYSTEDSKPFGKTSVSAYIFVPLEESDAGKTVRVVARSDSIYSGRANTVYIGEKADIWMYLVEQHSYKVVIAAFLLVISGFCIVISIILRLKYNKKIILEYLGWGIFYAAIWIISESRLRQLIFSNYSVAASMGFFVVMIIPLPVFIYMNELQKRRYQKVYMGLYALCIMDFITCVMLQITNTMDLLETLVVMQCVLIVSALGSAATIFVDFFKGKVKEYLMPAIGLAGMIASAVIEILLVYQKEQRMSGMWLCIGLLFLLVMAIIATGKDIMEIEREKQRAIVSGEAKLLFLANMSHEIRTPINTILGMNDVIIRENKDEELNEYLFHVQNAGKMLLTLVNDILDFSKLDTGNIEIDKQLYCPAVVLNDVVQMLQTRAKKKGLEVEVDIDRTIPSVLKGDDIRIRQIINNLLSNAIKYTDKGKVTLSVQKENKSEKEIYLCIRVKDTGRGIKQEDQKKLFDHFVRFDQRANRNIEGTGLGLSITKMLVDRMEGDINVRSEYGKGSVFAVTIPQEVEDVHEMGDFTEVCKRQLLEEEKQEETIHISEAPVLVVDDNEINLMVAKALLEDTALCIDSAMSGEECLAKTREKQYKVIFMDHMMPGMDGIETLHALRKEKNNPNTDTKVVVLTANALSGSREMYLQEGFDNYLSKPIDAREMKRMIAMYVEEI